METVANMFSLGKSFLAICWLIVDISNALHVAQMIHVEDRGWRGLLVARLHTHLLNIVAGLFTIAAPDTATMCSLSAFQTL